ncbi:MAG: hypothetical protein JXX29_10425 [Deltaproteobacteria bacterium]|nr:hypothetical protein [Deltaproteobacteria bacterium]MBN2672082.1 hypothetical protein [Deltaproteobacteria bacterium]
MFNRFYWFQQMRFSGFVFFLFIGVATVTVGCLCSDAPTDEMRLKKKIDTSVVHLYVASKVAITKTDASPQVKAAKAKLIQFVKSVEAAHHRHRMEKKNTGESVDDGARAETGSEQGGTVQFSASDWLAIAKSLWALKKEGEKIVQNDSEDEYAPILPVFLKHSGVNEQLIAMIDVKTEHALLYLVMSMLNIHEKSPVAVPGEILLYEAWKTDPEQIAFPSVAGPFHAMKAWTYGSNDLCDLSLAEAQSAEAWQLDSTAFGGEFRTIAQSKTAPALTNVEQLNAAVHAGGFGSVAYCHYARGNDKEARPHLRKFIDYSSQTGVLKDEDIAALEIFYQCGGDDASIEKGQTMLADIVKRADLPKEEIDVLTAYCDAADQTSIDAVRKVLFVAKVIQIGHRTAKESGLYDSLQGSEVYQTIAGFAGATEKLSATDTSQVKTKLNDIKNRAGDWLNKE